MISAHVPVQISDDEIIKVARQLYGIDGSLQRLPGEYDTNVRIWGDKQADVVLKIMHPSRIPSFIEMQIAALQHISTAAPAVPVQRVVAQRDGLLWSTVTIGTHSHVVWMLTYLEGTLFAEANPVDDALVAHLGETIARIDHGLQHLAFDAPERMLEWDVLNAGWIRGYTDALADEGERSLITRLVDRFESHYAVHRESVRIGLIHGDANDYNVIVGKPGYRTRRVTGVLDFGDMMRTAIVSELAISAAYMMMRILTNCII